MGHRNYEMASNIVQAITKSHLRKGDVTILQNNSLTAIFQLLKKSDNAKLQEFHAEFFKMNEVFRNLEQFIFLAKVHNLESSEISIDVQS